MKNGQHMPYDPPPMIFHKLISYFSLPVSIAYYIYKIVLSFESFGQDSILFMFDALPFIVLTALYNGIYSNDEFLIRKDEVNQKIESANSQLVLLKNQKTTREKSIAQIIPQLETVLSLYSKAESALEKNQLLKMVISKVIYTKTVKCHRNQDPSQYLKLQIFPRINL